MIQINLLPDIKQELIHAQRVRNYVISLSIIVGLVSIGIVVVLGLLLGTQLVRERLADGRIEDEFKKLSSTEDISEMVTIQNQLTKITDIHKQRSINSRMFDVLAAVNPPAPNTVQFTSVKTNPADMTMTIEGTADGGYSSVETLKKTITNARLSISSDNGTSESPLVDSVADGDSSLGEDSDGKKVVRFSLTLKYVAGLFDNTVKKAEIVLPQGRVDVTDSRKGVPASLFTEPAADVKEDN